VTILRCVLTIDTYAKQKADGDLVDERKFKAVNCANGVNGLNGVKGINGVNGHAYPVEDKV
jgi:hypothetical protein